ncbi:helix-turn-helix protein [Dokdonia sp. Hel_I_63]|uniref:helix-turn-helix domain-containing protein n=1 Tax=Dokdonia sp. Hel_I_63 TaxID=1249996 RepID=UPI00119B7853|nr:helix-turn-helix transcriptional regulator [Dokdonia sp. Hel_I_63]TVZ23445.1 helix-turn-helix protein [Dokdonia sp. Hel_I_63]
MNALQRIKNRITPEEKATMSNNMAIANQVLLLLQRKGMSQNDLAIKLGKSPSEVSKWLSGFHNLTTPTISKMEVAIGEKIIMTCDEAQLKYGRYIQLTIPAKPSQDINMANFRGLGTTRSRSLEIAS